MTAEHMRRHVKVVPPDSIELGDTRRRNWFDTIHRSRNILRMVESIVEIGAYLNLLTSFTKAEVLEDREIKILNWRHSLCGGNKIASVSKRHYQSEVQAFASQD